MGGFREEMREARGLVHDYMAVPALCFMDPAELSPQAVSVRVHEKWMALGDLKGTNFNYAEIEDIAPRMIFWRAQITPKRGMIVSVEAGVAFTVDNVLPPDDLTVTASVTRLLPDKTRGFPLPVVAP